MKWLKIIISLSITIITVALAVIAAIRFKDEIIAFFTDLSSKARNTFGGKSIYVKLDDEFSDFADV